jgi:hypothetical protein
MSTVQTSFPVWSWADVTQSLLYSHRLRTSMKKEKKQRESSAPGTIASHLMLSRVIECWVDLESRLRTYVRTYCMYIACFLDIVYRYVRTYFYVLYLCLHTPRRYVHMGTRKASDSWRTVRMYDYDYGCVWVSEWVQYEWEMTLARAHDRRAFGSGAVCEARALDTVGLERAPWWSKAEKVRNNCVPGSTWMTLARARVPKISLRTVVRAYCRSRGWTTDSSRREIFRRKRCGPWLVVKRYKKPSQQTTDN